MMDNNNPFRPENVDEQIERFSRYVQRDPSSVLSDAENADEKLIADLHLMYRQGAPLASTEEDAQSLRYSWMRITAIAAEKRASRSGRIMRQNARNRAMTQENKPGSNVLDLSERRTWRRRVGLIAAACMVILVVGSMALLFNAAHLGRTTIGTSPSPTAVASAQPTINSSVKLSKNVGKVVYTWNGRQHGQTNSPYNDLAWSKDSKRIASASQDNIAVWDATTGAHSVLFNGGYRVVKWSPDGKHIASTNGGQIQIWDPATKTVLQTFTYPGVPVANVVTSNGMYLDSYVPQSGGILIYDFAWSPDGKKIVAANPFHNGTPAKESMIVWDLATQKVTTRFVSDEVDKIAWSPDGKFIASSSGIDGTVRVWDAQTGRNVYTLQAPGKPDVARLAWSPTDAGRLLIGFLVSGTLESIDATNGANLLRYSTNVVNISSVAWSPDGKIVAAAGRGVQMFDAKKNVLLYTYLGNAHYISSMAWSPDGKYIATGDNVDKGGSNTSDVKVWNAR